MLQKEIKWACCIGQHDAKQTLLQVEIVKVHPAYLATSPSDDTCSANLDRPTATHSNWNNNRPYVAETRVIESSATGQGHSTASGVQQHPSFLLQTGGICVNGSW